MRYGYHRPAYVRLAWGAGIAVALVVALGLAARATVRAIRQDERTTLQREGNALLTQALAHARTLRRERDSLAAVVARVDTVLVTRIRRVRDTAWLPADTAPVVRLAACRVELEQLATACESYRVAATAALATADTLHLADSTALAALSHRLILTRRADSLAVSRLSQRPRWRTVFGVALGAGATGFLLGVLY